MKLIYVTRTFWPNVGGLENFVKALAENVAKLGHEVHVITSTIGAGDRPREEVMNNVHIHRIKSIKLHYLDICYPLDYPKDILKNVDVVHIFSQNSLFNIMMGDKAKKMGYKVCCHFLAINALFDHPNIIVRYLGSLYDAQCTLKAIKFSDLKLVMGFRDKYILKNKYKVDNVYIIPDGVPKQYFTIPKGNAEDFRKKFGIKQEKFYLFIGRIHKLKGPHIIIKALKKVGENVAAVFIGPDNGYLKECLKMAFTLGVEDKVYMLGYVNEYTKIAAIDSAIAVISPSLCNYVEVFPIAIWEAWARGKPVIASKVGDIPYRIKHGINGLLFNPSNHIELANCMTILLDNKKLADELGKNGKKCVLTWDKIAIKTIELYRRILV